MKRQPISGPVDRSQRLNLGLELLYVDGEIRSLQGAFDFRVASPEVSPTPPAASNALWTRRRFSETSDEHGQNGAVPANLRATPLLVTFVDEMLAQGLYNQSLPEVVSLMAQTNVYMTAHGANTWATVFMPKRSAVIEIYGPCGPATWLSNTIVPALELKHRTEGNPWGRRVALPLAGNTTE